MNNRQVLISGAGIAGTTLAFWLKRFGFNPTIIEIAPGFREGGYAIDFIGAGYDVAEKMGIIPALERVDMGISKLSYVDGNNRERGSLNYGKIKSLLNNRAFTLLRSDLAKAIYNSLPNDVEIIFGDSITEIEQLDDAVIVSFQNGATRTFDLVVGADGLHSKVRELAFGSEDRFENYYGYYTSSFTLENLFYEGRAFSMYNVPNKQVAIYSYDENKTVSFFIFGSPGKLSYEHRDAAKQKEILKAEFMNTGWKCPEILARLDSATDFYFDSVSQIRMQNWSNGRVALVGDACYCPSLLSGKGSTLAMVGAYILAGELKQANGDHTTAFERYQNIFEPFMDKKQKAAQSFAKSFVPKTSFGIWLRNAALKLVSLPFVPGLLLNQFKDKELQLKAYE